MAVIAHVLIRSVTPEQYAQVRAEARYLEDVPAGGLLHVTWWEGGDCHAIDAWESEETFKAFAAERFGPALAKVGVTSTPEVTLYPASEVYVPQPVMLT